MQVCETLGQFCGRLHWQCLLLETIVPVMFRMTKTCQEFMNDNKKIKYNKPLYLKLDCSHHLETANGEKHKRIFYVNDIKLCIMPQTLYRALNRMKILTLLARFSSRKIFRRNARILSPDCANWKISFLIRTFCCVSACHNTNYLSSGKLS